MLTQRSIAQAFLALQAAVTAALAVALSAQGAEPAWASVAAALIGVACWSAFRRGWAPARQVAVITLTLLLVLVVDEPYLHEKPMLGVLLPPIVALMLTSAPWIVVSAVLGLLGLIARGGFASPLLAPLELGVFATALFCLVVARMSMDGAMARMTTQVRQAEAARASAEATAQRASTERDCLAKLDGARLRTQRLESVGRLAGGVAHDFNNLLTVIGASISMAERALVSGRSATEDLNEVQLAVARASELTKQLLAFARKQVLVKRSVELNDLVSGAEPMLRRLVGETATLCTKLDPRSLRVMADARQLEQVVLNLVVNARDALRGRGSIEITTRRLSVLPGVEQEVEGLTCGEYACLQVRDDGVGMAPDVQRQLFEPFFTTKPPGRGTGLGLATCFGIVRQHEGAIRVESDLGRGTTMCVLLPLATAEATVATSGVVPLGAHRRVLVVEDEPQVRAIAARALANAGFEVLQAPNGAAALALLKAELRPIDVIVTDVLMPEMNGLELARAVRAAIPNMPLVFMSGYPEAMHDVNADELVGASFLAKPFAAQQLVDAVRERVQEHATHDVADA